MTARTTPALILLAVAGAAGCKHSYPIASDGLASWKQTYYDATSAYADMAPPERFVHTGHQAGSYREYARTVKTTTVRPREARDVVDLMDQSFNGLGLTAVELDVQLARLPQGPAVVIVHDEIHRHELEGRALEYAGANTVERILDHFVDQGYHRQGRHVYFELKSRHGWDAPLADKTIEMLNRLAAVIATYDRHPEARRIRRSIGFFAFSYEALHYLHIALDGDGPARYSYFLMATSNRFAEWTFQWTVLPPFNERVQEILATTPWISGTVFAPRWINRYGPIFNGINASRLEQGLKPIDLYFALYAESYENYVAGLKRQTNGGADRIGHVSGFVYEIRRPRERPPRHPGD